MPWPQFQASDAKKKGLCGTRPLSRPAPRPLPDCFDDARAGSRALSQATTLRVDHRISRSAANGVALSALQLVDLSPDRLDH